MNVTVTWTTGRFASCY